MAESAESRLVRLMSEPAAAPAPEPAQAPEPRAAVPEFAPEPVAQPAAPQAPSADAPETDDAPTVTTLSELAEAIGVDVSDLYSLQIPVTSVDGERQDVSLGEWKDAYQSHSKTEKLRVELDARRAALAQQEAQATGYIQQRTQEVNALLNAAENELVREFQGVDWNGLKAADPGEWAAKRQEFIERQNAVNAAKAKATHDAQRMHSEQEGKLVAQRQEVLQREAGMLRSAIPEWRDETKATAEKAELFDYLVSSGFKTDDVSSVVDHRVVVLARKAMLYDKRKADGQEAVKKLVKIAPTKMLKPGAGQTKADQQIDRNEAIRGRLKKSGRLEDFAALITRR